MWTRQTGRVGDISDVCTTWLVGVSPHVSTSGRKLGKAAHLLDNVHTTYLITATAGN